MTDTVSWADKARSLLTFAKEAHNATWNSQNSLVQAGAWMGNAILLSFTAECAIKALLESENKQITSDLRIHRLYVLYDKLETQTQTKASAVYTRLIESETDERIHIPATNSLNSCLKSHDNAFKKWRYDIANAGTFYPVPMMYACVSLLTFVHPKQVFVVGSQTAPTTQIVGGEIERHQLPRPRWKRLWIRLCRQKTD